MSCIQCGMTSDAVCCYRYSCGMCDFTWLKKEGPCGFHNWSEEE